ncbi:MAG TPA: hypothetical protein VLE53_15625 [Gemmatimonadaceae bacterium]|nr:hypothetical protein [Gemmatimonadaceae bacterium]
MMRLRNSCGLAALLALGGVACDHPSNQSLPGELGADLVEPDSINPTGSVRIRFTNPSPDPVFGAADVRADPGFWLRPVRQDLHLYRIPPETTIVVEARYEFSRVSPGAVLHVRAGVPELRADRVLAIPEPVLVRSVDLGSTTEARAFIGRFDTVASKHLTLYALRNGPAVRALPSLLVQRESAAVAIGRFLQVEPPGGIRMVFYPDSASKTTDTRHIGNGWANGSNIVEIYNDSTRVDPYHELTHLIAARAGGPPAWLDEGLATWMSEHFGADALELLGFSGLPVREAGCRLERQDKLVPATRLFGVREFGGDSVPGDVAYAESAAMVQYLIERLGAPRFLELFARLEAGISAVPVDENRRTFEGIVGGSVETFEREYREWLRAACGNRSVRGA